MTPTFLDTSFLIALALKQDAYHQRALDWQSATVGDVLTTEYVLIEFADALSAERVRPLVAQTVAELRTDRRTRVIPASTELLNQGLHHFTNHRDKRWSLTDCLSFCVMLSEGVAEALTSDHHFEQAGFRALLRSNPP